MPLLTTIVPVYNVEKYIRTGLESLLVQGMRDGEHEILLIDDGSTDSSGRICDEYAAKYPSLIRVIHKPNGGVSSARNLGIREAKGDYIHFMDPDDYLNEGAYKLLIDKLLDLKVDYLGFERNEVSAEKCDGTTLKNSPIDINIESMWRGKELVKTIKMWSEVWRYLVRRSFILENGIMFDESMKVGEDFLFNYLSMSFDPKIALTSAKIYNYYVRSGSAVTSFPRERLKMWIEGIAHQVEGLREIGNNHKDLKSTMDLRIETQMVWFLPKLLRFKMTQSDSRYICDEFRRMRLLPLIDNNLVAKSANLVLTRPMFLPVFAMLYRRGLFSLLFKLLCIINPKKYK